MDKLVYQYIKRYEPNVEADDLSNLKKQLVILLNKKLRINLKNCKIKILKNFIWNTLLH